MGMVGMFVAVEDAVQPIDFGIEQLVAQIGRGVDKNARDAPVAAPLDQQRRAPATVLRIVRIAGAPAKRRSRHAGGRAAAQNGECQGHAAVEFWSAGSRRSAAPPACGTFLNSRKKLSVVWRATSSRETPRDSASTLTVSTT